VVRLSHLIVAVTVMTAVGVTAAGADDRELIEAGHALYDMHCMACHGERLQNPGTSFDLRELHPNERARFETSVLDGKGAQMPPWRGVFDEAEIDQLWAYVRENAYD
jgi:mono/diheme cytochrome c family protein